MAGPDAQSGSRPMARAGIRPVALVTGGSRGIGFGCATALAREGFDLVVCGLRREEEVKPALDELRSRGGEAIYVQADVGGDETAEKLIDATRSRFGRLDVLVNNAGVAPKERKDILEATRESFDRLVRINLRGPYFLTQAAARFMIDQRKVARSAQLAPGPGCIIFVTSISASVASVNRGEYCISKAGLSMASLLWAARLADEGISVYEVRPGIVRTDMTSGVVAKYDALIRDGLLLQRRWGMPEDVGKAVAMLARGDLAYSTGQVIEVDGGFMVRRL